LYEIREYVEVGGLMSYGTVFRDGYYKGGKYTGRILKGVKPAELPVEQVNKLELVVNTLTSFGHFNSTDLTNSLTEGLLGSAARPARALWSLNTSAHAAPFTGGRH